VDVDHGLEVGDAHLAQRGVAGDPRVVDHDVEPAEPVDGMPYGGRDGVLVGDVAGQAGHRRTVPERLGGGLRQLGVPVGEHHPGAVLAQQGGDGQPDALARPGDQRRTARDQPGGRRGH
jgi:hypothetical protein